MADRNSLAWKISSEIEPNFNGGLIHNDWIKGTVFIKKTRAQRNNIPLLSRVLTTENSTMCFVLDDNIFYKLITNPASETTQDTDWGAILTGSGSNVKPIGTWDISNLNPPLIDLGAYSINGNFYYATGAPTPTIVQHASLFGGQEREIVNNDQIISIGTQWEVIKNATSWEQINKPQVIIDYENGIVIPHLHSLSDITGLIAELETKYDIDDLANMVLDFVEVPDAGIVNVAFLRKHFYDKTFVYTKDEVDALLSLITTGDTDFDWNRPIRKLPVVGKTPVGDKVTEGLESIFYGFIEPTIYVNPFPVAEVGVNFQNTIIGSLDPKDAYSIVGNIIVRDKDNNVAATIVPNAAPAITNFNTQLIAAIIVAGNSQWYTLEYSYVEVVDGPTINVVSDPFYVKGVYPFLYGLAADGLIGSNMYTSLTKVVADRSMQRFNFNDLDKRIYIAYPTIHGYLTEALDEAGNNVLESLFPTTPDTVAVESAGLGANWTQNYYLYKSQYNGDVADQDYTIFFGVNGQYQETAPNLDAILEGTTNKHFTVGEKEKLAGITMPGADMGDMKKSAFVTLFPTTNIVNRSATTALLALNSSGGIIPAGKYVKITQKGATYVEIAVADKDSNDVPDGFTIAAIDDAATGLIILQGENELINTSGAILNADVYLGVAGGVLFTAPSSGALIKIGKVTKVGNPGTILSREYNDLIKQDVHQKWRANTNYKEDTVTIYDDGDGKILLRSKADHNSGGSFNAANYDILSGDMRKYIYDPDNDGVVDQTLNQIIAVHNNTGSTLVKGKLVSITGYDSVNNAVYVELADKSIPLKANGIIVADILDGVIGIMIASGFVKDINTSGMTVNDTVYLNLTGDYTNVKPTTGLIQEIGVVVLPHVSTGIIYVSPKVSDVQPLVYTFPVTGGTVVTKQFEGELIVELQADATYTLPEIATLTNQDFFINLKNTSGVPVMVIATDLVEEAAQFTINNKESYRIFISGNKYRMS